MKGVQANTRGIKVVFKEVYQVVVLFYNQFCLSLSLFAERLYNSNGRDLRRALFSLKQIFQVTHTLTHTPTHFSHAITVSLLLQSAVGYCGPCALL